MLYTTKMCPRSLCFNTILILWHTGNKSGGFGHVIFTLFVTWSVVADKTKVKTTWVWAELSLVLLSGLLHTWQETSVLPVCYLSASQPPNVTGINDRAYCRLACYSFSWQQCRFIDFITNKRNNVFSGELSAPPAANLLKWINLVECVYLHTH